MERKGHAARRYRNVVHCIVQTYRNEGVAAVQKGLSGAFAYQLVMNGVRLGTYTALKNVAGAQGSRALAPRTHSRCPTGPYLRGARHRFAADLGRRGLNSAPASRC